MNTPTLQELMTECDVAFLDLQEAEKAGMGVHCAEAAYQAAEDSMRSHPDYPR